MGRTLRVLLRGRTSARPSGSRCPCCPTLPCLRPARRCSPLRPRCCRSCPLRAHPLRLLLRLRCTAGTAAWELAAAGGAALLLAHLLAAASAGQLAGSMALLQLAAAWAWAWARVAMVLRPLVAPTVAAWAWAAATWAATAA